jgi:protein TonB
MIAEILDYVKKVPGSVTFGVMDCNRVPEQPSGVPAVMMTLGPAPPEDLGGFEASFRTSIFISIHLRLRSYPFKRYLGIVQMEGLCSELCDGLYPRVSEHRGVIEMSPNASLRADYGKYLYISLLAAVLIHAAAFAFWPEYVPSVYNLPVEIVKPFEWVPDYEEPPKPPEIPAPPAPADILPSDDVGLDETIGPNFIDLKDLPVPPPPPLREPTSYIWFDKQPALVTAAEPAYPELARKAEIEGSVTVLVTVNESGRVAAARVGHSDAEIFNQAAIRAALDYIFSPAEQNGIPVKATIAITFRFTLSE